MAAPFGSDDRSIAWTVRRQRPQSAPAPQAAATSLVVQAPASTASVTVWLVTPLHRQTNIPADRSVRLDAHHVGESPDEESARRWIEHPDAAAEWMSGAGVGPYPPVFVGRFSNMMRIEAD
ncbi:hypothetical protein A9X05_06445 [Mycobacterium sp. E3298]|nr:hypothetical protein A9X05_06445 [Mycobacterium sp. E3298]